MLLQTIFIGAAVIGGTLKAPTHSPEVSTQESVVVLARSAAHPWKYSSRSIGRQSRRAAAQEKAANAAAEKDRSALQDAKDRRDGLKDDLGKIICIKNGSC